MNMGDGTRVLGICAFVRGNIGGATSLSLVSEIIGMTCWIPLPLQIACVWYSTMIRGKRYIVF